MSESAKTLYTLRCGQTGESQNVLVCEQHAAQMPSVDGERVTVQSADPACPCEFCPSSPEEKTETQPPQTESARLERETCSRCGGSGHYSYCQRFGTTCFKCGGKGQVLTKRGQAANAFLRQLRSRPASELTVGQKIRIGSITVGGDPYETWATVDSIAPYENTTRSWVGGVEQPQRQDLLEIRTTNKHETCCHNGIAPEALYLVAQTPEQAAETLAQAIAYQATLTKQGKPRKQAA